VRDTARRNCKMGGRHRKEKEKSRANCPKEIEGKSKGGKKDEEKGPSYEIPRWGGKYKILGVKPPEKREKKVNPREGLTYSLPYIRKFKKERKPTRRNKNPLKLLKKYGGSKKSRGGEA